MSAPVDPAVRSIRIAATLNERFGVILRSPLTPGGGVSELELRIGEAQQIYPEIWNHLDEARATLAGRGVRTTSYETVRALEPKGSLGVNRIEVHGYSSTLTMELLDIQDGAVKHAEFNRDGHQRANLAIKALMEAMPEVDFKALERAEAAEIYAAGSLGPINQKSVIKWLVIGGGGLLAVYLFWFLIVREKPRDHAGERKQHIAALKARLDAGPCDKHSLDSLTYEEGWDEPKITDHRPTIERYDGLCQDVITRLERELDATPCDTAKQDELRSLVGARSGVPKRGTKAASKYRDLCAGSAATVPP